MLASELISILQSAIDENGDLDVLIKDDGYFSSESATATYYPPFQSPVIVKLTGDYVIHVRPETDSSRGALGDLETEIKHGKALIIGKTVDRP